MSRPCQHLPQPALAALALITVAGAALRLLQAQESLWLDELHTAWCASGSLGEVAERATAGNQSPLFFWGEWLLFRLGQNEIMLRLPSLLAGGLLPPAVFAVTHRLTRSGWLGVFAAWLVMIDPLSILFATEARPYALVQFLSVLHVLLFSMLLKHPTAARRVAFVLGAALLFHLHYTVALLLAAELTFWVFQMEFRRQTAYRLLPALTDAAIIVLLCLPAVANILDIAGRRENWAAFVPQQPVWMILALFPLSGAALYVTADLIAEASTRRTSAAEIQHDGRHESASLALCWFFVPVSIAWLLTALDVARLFFPRYLVFAAPAAFVLTAKYARLAPWKPLQVALAIAISLISLWSSGIAYQFHRDGRAIADRQEDWRSAIAFLNQQLQHDRQLVLVRSGLIEDDALRESHSAELRAYCLFPVTSLYPIQCLPSDFIPLPSTDSGRLSDQTKSRVRQAGSAWIILRAPEQTARAIERQLLDNLNRDSSRIKTGSNWHVSAAQSFGKVHVRQIRRSPDDSIRQP